MKINLLFFNGEKITFDESKIKSQVVKLRKELNNFLNNEKKNKKDIINMITLLIKDLDYNLNTKEVENIINRKNSTNDIEKLINNLFETLELFFKKNKTFHKGNFSKLFLLINNDEESFEEKPIFRKTNEIIIFDKKNYIKVQDFNKVNSSLEQFIDFINSPKNKEFCPLICMQIINIHSLLISPFCKYNLMFSKILSMWYLNVFENKLFKKIPSELYFHIIQKNNKKYIDKIKESFETGDYTNSILFLINKMNSYLNIYNLNEKIIKYLKYRFKKFLANHEQKFLFIILFNNLIEFDWKLFKKISEWNISKQYIILNLTKLEKEYNLLKSKKYKNRKFFMISQHLKNIINEILKTKELKEGVN